MDPQKFEKKVKNKYVNDCLKAKLDVSKALYMSC